MNENTKFILQIDGGGVRGIIPAIVCAELEKNLGKPLYSIFDLMTGTSTGSIICGGLAFGMDAEVIKSVYFKEIPELFKRRPLWNPKNWFREKYDREPFQKRLFDFLGRQILCEAKTKFMAATFNLSSQRTHFIKSWDSKDSDWSIVDVMSWSGLSAAFYFGKINVSNYEWTCTDYAGEISKKMGASFQDGGQGVNNSTLEYDLIESLAQDWHNVVILSLGTGHVQMYTPYEKTSKMGYLRQTFKYFTEAQKEAIKDQVLAGAYVNKNRDDYTVCRLDADISKKQDKIDAVKYIDDFEKIGYELAAKIPYDIFK